MSGSYNLTVGDRGRVVLPAELRQRLDLREGTPLILMESAEGMVLLTREQLEKRVRSELEGPSLVDELLAERRAAAAEEDKP